MKVELARHLRQAKGGINPNSYPNEKFEYYSLPDYDSFKKPSLVHGTVIESNKTLFSGKSVLISKLNPRIKRVWLTEDDNALRKICSTEFLCLKTSDELSLEYTYYAIKQDQVFEYLDSCAIGSTNSHVRFKFSDLVKVKINLPPLPIQRKIARILSTIDGQIEKTEAIIAKYQAVKQGMLQDLFTRGIDVRTGELRPRYEDAPELYKESALGMIPKEWEVVRLINLIKIKHGFAFQGEFFSDEPNGYILLTPGNFHIGGGLYFTNGNTKYYTGPFPEEYVLKNGDVLNVMTDLTKEMAILGKTVILDRSEYVLHNQRIGKVLFSSESIVKEFLVDMLNSKFVLDEVKSTATGTTVRHTSPSKIYNSLIPLPKSNEQEFISTRYRQIHKKIDSEHRILSKLQLLKQGLMQDLLSGNVEVTP